MIIGEDSTKYRFCEECQGGISLNVICDRNSGAPVTCAESSLSPPRPSKITLGHRGHRYLSLLSSYSHAVPFPSVPFAHSPACSLFSRRPFIHNFFAGTRSYGGGVSIWNSTTTRPPLPLPDKVETTLSWPLLLLTTCSFVSYRYVSISSLDSTFFVEES